MAKALLDASDQDVLFFILVTRICHHARSMMANEHDGN